MRPPHFDVTIIGGGIIGLATARELLLRSPLNLLVLEASPNLASHQTLRNSGVIHAGLYYKPNSLKSRLCLAGLKATYAYCTANNIPHRKVGKLIIAQHPSQLPALHALHQNALTNKVPDVRLLTSIPDIHAIEPHAAAIAAIHSPHTGIVDWSLVAHQLAHDIRSRNATITTNARLLSVHRHSATPHLTLSTTHPQLHTLTTERLITCAGAQSDRVAQMFGGASAPRIVPVRGEYLRVTNQRVADQIRGNIYPVPDSRDGTPFLGVHFTRTMSDEVIVGPNAVLALSRQGYTPGTFVNARDVMDMVTYAGFWRLCARNVRFGMREIYRSVVLSAAATAAMEMVPALGVADFERRGLRNSGIRGQAVDVDGGLVDDFVFESAAGGRVLHTRNAPSPGATSALAIAKVIVDRSEKS